MTGRQVALLTDGKNSPNYVAPSKEREQRREEESAVRTEAELVARMPQHALERYADFAPGDTIGITLGAELYSPIKYNTFTVGPFSATVVVRPEETGADAAMRCYRVLLELNEAEFQIAWGRQRERVTTIGGSKR